MVENGVKIRALYTNFIIVRSSMVIRMGLDGVSCGCDNS